MAPATPARRHEDRTSGVIGLLNHFWLALLSDDHLREEAGLRYASHMWDVHPYWYLWLAGSRGVYRLELSGAQEVSGYDWVAEFLVKYYPAEEEDFFQGLSFLEKICRQSEIFKTRPARGGGCPCHGGPERLDGEPFADLQDGTGVPSAQYADCVSPEFFYAGHLLLAHRSGAGSLLRLKSQSSWRVFMTRDYGINDADGHLLGILRNGQRDRDYPGLAIMEPLYRHLVRGWRSFHQYPVCHERLWKGEGVRFDCDGETLVPVPSGEIERVIRETLLSAGEGTILPTLEDADMDGMK